MKPLSIANQDAQAMDASLPGTTGQGGFLFDLGR